MVGWRRVDQGVELAGGERIAVVDAVPPECVKVPAIQIEVRDLSETRASLSTSVKVKSPEAKLSGVSSLVLTVLMLATGTSLTAVTSIFMVAATVPAPRR